MPMQRGQLEICSELNEIVGPGGRQRLEPQAMAVLELLAREPGKVWSREALPGSAWPERVVPECARAADLVANVIDSIGASLARNSQRN